MWRYLPKKRHKFFLIGAIVLMVLGFGLLAILDQTGLLNIAHHSKARSLSEIKSSQILRVATLNNSTSYFIYKGRPMGFHHDLAERFCEDQDLKCEFYICQGYDDALKMVQEGKADLIAMDLTPTPKRKHHLRFTSPIGVSQSVVVQRKKENSAHFISKIEQLDDQEIHVQIGTIFKDDLHKIKRKQDIDLEIMESDEGMESLIQMVAQGTISFTVCDERLARANATFEDNIDISMQLSKPLPLAWAVDKNADSLEVLVNSWLKKIKKSKKLKTLEQKYFNTQKNSFYTDEQNLVLRSGQLCEFDSLIKLNAVRMGWDWRILAAIIYHESRFNPKAESWAGAQGLMQLMPNTGQNFGLKSPFDPKQNIKAGTSLLIALQKKFSQHGIQGVELQKFTIAAFHSGYGHVSDAIQLADHYQVNNKIWTQHVDSFMIRKSYAKYYRQKNVKYGYSRGYQTVRYVEDVLNLYHHYQNLVEL